MSLEFQPVGHRDDFPDLLQMQVAYGTINVPDAEGVPVTFDVIVGLDPIDSFHTVAIMTFYDTDGCGLAMWGIKPDVDPARIVRNWYQGLDKAEWQSDEMLAHAMLVVGFKPLDVGARYYTLDGIARRVQAGAAVVAVTTPEAEATADEN